MIGAPGQSIKAEATVRKSIIPAALLLITSLQAAAAALPPPSDKPALAAPHFPDRLHAFVWRNWGVADSQRIAAVLGTSVENVRAIATSMGLAEQPETPPQERIYLSIIRRNWHLLDYDQLLTLLDWTPQRLAHTLREDDFLWIKLGSLKPRCGKLSYAEPDDQVRRRAAEIRELVSRSFARDLATPAERRFAFLERFTRPVKAADAPPPRADAAPRFLYSYSAVFGDALADPSLDPFPDALLHELSRLGVNGVWLHTVLRDLAPSQDFPEFGRGAQQRLEALAALVSRAKRRGVGVYLYVNEPRAMPHAFFDGRAELAGVREGDFTTMCTSHPRVRQWLAASLEHIFRAVPDLAGVFTITASENLTSCASHHNHKNCPRCRSRSAAEIIAEVNAIVEAAVHKASPSAKVITWDWGWPDDAAPGIIKSLPKSVWLQSVSEWSLPLNRGGVKTSVGEYSLSAVGPGPRAKRHWQLARGAGLKTSAKVQANITWELSAVPWLPVLDLVAEHAHGLAAANVDGLMLSWTLGGYPSPNLEIFHRITTTKPTPEPSSVLDEIARQRYGADATPHARRAWTHFANAFREYPYDGNVIYTCPAQLGPANLLYEKPTGYAATMIGFPYDDVRGWSGPYGPWVFASQLEKLSAGWAEGLRALETAIQNTPANLADEARRDLVLARAAGLHLSSVARQTRFVVARDALARAAPDQRAALIGELTRLLAAESAAACELFSLARQDSRIGFEASNHYYYLPHDLIEKDFNCQALLRHYAAQR
jgi:hypothetical protein